MKPFGSLANAKKMGLISIVIMSILNHLSELQITFY